MLSILMVLRKFYSVFIFLLLVNCKNNQKDDFNQLRGHALGTTYSISYSSSKLSKNLLSQKIDRENKLTLLALEHERRSAKAAQMVSKILKNYWFLNEPFCCANHLHSFNRKTFRIY